MRASSKITPSTGTKIAAKDRAADAPSSAVDATGFYYPEQPATQNTQTGGYINEWRFLGEVVRWEDERLYLHSKNKIEPGMTIEFLFPGHAPVEYVVPERGLLDDDGNEVDMINRPAKEFSIPCPTPIPTGAMIRAQMRRAVA